MLQEPSRLRTLILGVDPKQEMRASQALFALAVYLVFAVVQHVEVLAGLIDETASWMLTAWNLCGGVGFYALVRSGLNLRRRRDRALTMPQMQWAMVGVAWAYAITGPARGAVMLIMLLVLLVGMLALTKAQARRLTALGFCMLAGVMVWKGVTDPVRYEPRVEALHLCFVAIVMLAVSALAIRIGRLRERLEVQRGELVLALERIRSLATKDELTGLLNRRAMIERLGLACGNDAGAPRRFCVALIDLDHFKRINDGLGHAAGDEVLRRFAATISDGIDADDIVARWGGEEFLLAMPGADLERGLEKLERVRQRLRQLSLDDLDPGLRLSFSGGVAACGEPADIEASIERADAAMYRAKSAGRDRSFAANAASGRQAVLARDPVGDLCMGGEPDVAARRHVVDQLAQDEAA